MTDGARPAADAPEPNVPPTLQEMAESMRDIYLQVLGTSLGTTSTQGSCLYASILLQQAVAKFVGVPAVVRGGGCECGGGFVLPDGVVMGHYWVEAAMPDGDAWVVDITADQFGGEPVTVGRLDALSSRYVAGDQALVDAHVAEELEEIKASAASSS